MDLTLQHPSRNPVPAKTAPARSARRRALPRRLRRGLGPFETILGIILLVVFVLFLMRLYNSSSTSMASMQLVNQAQRITAAVDSAYANSGSYDNQSLIPVLYASGSFSKRTIPDTTHMWSPYHTEVDVAGSSTGTQYTVDYTSLPLAACSSLLNSFTGQTSTKLLTSTVNGKVLADVPPTPSDVATACSKPTANDVQLTF